MLYNRFCGRGFCSKRSIVDSKKIDYDALFDDNDNGIGALDDNDDVDVDENETLLINSSAKLSSVPITAFLDEEDRKYPMCSPVRFGQTGFCFWNLELLFFPEVSFDFNFF